MFQRCWSLRHCRCHQPSKETEVCSSLGQELSRPLRSEQHRAGWTVRFSSPLARREYLMLRLKYFRRTALVKVWQYFLIRLLLRASGRPVAIPLIMDWSNYVREKRRRHTDVWLLLNNSIQCMFNSIIHHHSHCLFHYKLVQLHFLSLLLTSVFVRVPGNPKTFVSCSINTCNVMDLCHKQRVLITAPRQSLA